MDMIQKIYSHKTCKEGEKRVGSSKHNLTKDLVVKNKSQRPDRVNFDV